MTCEQRSQPVRLEINQSRIRVVEETKPHCIRGAVGTHTVGRDEMPHGSCSCAGHGAWWTYKESAGNSGIWRTTRMIMSPRQACLGTNDAKYGFSREFLFGIWNAGRSDTRRHVHRRSVMARCGFSRSRECVRTILDSTKASPKNRVLPLTCWLGRRCGRR